MRFVCYECEGDLLYGNCYKCNECVKPYSVCEFCLKKIEKDHTKHEHSYKKFCKLPQPTAKNLPLPFGQREVTRMKSEIFEELPPFWFK